jgi:hypothetical protein
MNKQQRIQISKLSAALVEATDNGMPLPELKELVKSTVSELETLRDDEQEKYDNMPESLQASSKGEALEEGIQYLDDAIHDLGSIDDSEEGEEDEVGQVIGAAVDSLSNLE